MPVKRIRLASRMMSATAAAFVLLAAFAPSAQSAEGDRKVFGFLTSAEATPLAIEYNQPSFGVPATPTFEMRFMHSLATSDSGPSSQGLSTVMWPGDLAGNSSLQLAWEQIIGPSLDPLINNSPGPLADALREVRDSIGEQTGQAPPYPVRAESFHPAGPPSDSTELGGGIRMRSRADDGLAEALTSGSNGGFPGVIDAGNMNSRAFAGIQNGIAHAEAFAHASGIKLFGGIVSVDSVTNQVTARSDGVKAWLDGNLKISGLTLNYPDGSGGTVTVEVVSIDDRGVVINDQPRMNWDQARKFFEEELSPHGITITMLEAQRENVSGAAASRALSGLEIRMDSRAMAAMRDSLPEPVRGWVSSPGSSPANPIYNELPTPISGFVDSIVQFDQSMTFVFGNVAVDGAASPPYSFTAPTPPLVLPPPLVPPSIVLGETSFGPQSVPGGFGAPSGPVPVIGGAPVAVGVSGLSGLLALALAMALGGSFALRSYAERATSGTVGVGDRCNLET